MREENGKAMTQEIAHKADKEDYEKMLKNLMQGTTERAETVEKKPQSSGTEENTTNSIHDLKDGIEAIHELESLFGQTEDPAPDIHIHIGTLNLHIGDHMESVNFMDSYDEVEFDEGEEVQDDPEDDVEFAEEGAGDFPDDFPLPECVTTLKVDHADMIRAISKIEGIKEETVGQVLHGASMYLEALAKYQYDLEEMEGGKDE